MLVSIAEGNASVGVSGLGPDEAAVAFDQIVRDSFGLSGAEFLAALDDGKFDDVDPDARPGLLNVLMAFSLTAHCAKPPGDRFCKAGVRGSIPLVSTHPGPRSSGPVRTRRTGSLPVRVAARP